MGDDRPQRLHKRLGQTLDRRASMNLFAIQPIHMEAAPSDKSVDLQRMTPVPPRAAGGPDGLLKQYEWRRLRQDLIELAQGEQNS